MIWMLVLAPNRDVKANDAGNGGIRKCVVVLKALFDLCQFEYWVNS